MQNEFHRIAIVNRGEAAMRFIHAAREFRQEHDVPLQTIALFTQPDRQAMFVREADETVSLGAAQFIDPDTHRPKSTYLDYGRLAEALASAHAEAVWVGWGFVAEHAAFADLCREMGIVFIGPPGDVMRRLGDKIAAKRLAEESQIPVVPWSGGPVETLTDAFSHVERFGFPVLIKATAGGGGRGIRVVHTADQLSNCFEAARSEAFKAFGDPTIFIEKVVSGARHVEVQIIADQHGTTWAVGVRDCTIQRRHQKVLEEAPSPALSSEEDEELRQAAVRLSKTAGYCNAGTVEFLCDPERHRFWFMEVNTRLQVEHPVTECTTGLDLVKLQIQVAQGCRLEGDCPQSIGHAVEVRLNAEDPENGFAAAPGTIEYFRVATGPGVRVDTGVAEGEGIPAEFDSMIAKVIGFGKTRKEALSRLRRALQDSTIVIKGGTSNKAFLLEMLSRSEVQDGIVDVGWLDRLSAGGDHLSSKYADIALLYAAIDAYDADLALEHAQFYASAARGRPRVRSEIGRTHELRYRGQLYSLKSHRLSLQDYRVDVDGEQISAHIQRMGQFESRLTVFERRFHIVSAIQGTSARIEVDGVSHRVDRDDGGVVHAPMPAVVVSIAVKPGDLVAVGDHLAVLEAMKMETKLVAPFSGKVRQVMTMPNVQVATGAPLFQIEAEVDDNIAPLRDRVVFGPSLILDKRNEAPQSQCRDTLKELRQLMLGFDLDPMHCARQFAAWSKICPADSEEIRKGEDEILNIFADICSLFQREPEAVHRMAGEQPSAEAYLFSYLRMAETGGESFPARFVDALRRALAHYGVTALDGSSKVKESLLWICKSHERMEQQAACIVDILGRRMQHAKAAESRREGSFRALLDRIIAIARDLYPSVSELARELRYRYFDQPSFERSRARVYEEAERHLAYLAAHPDAEDRAARIQMLVQCPHLLASLFASHFPAADYSLRHTMIEVLTRRYYKIRKLLNPSSAITDGHCYVSDEYDYQGKRIHVFAMYASYDGLSAAVQALFPVIAEVPADDDIVIDFNVCHSRKLDDPDVTEREVQSMLNHVPIPRPIRRIVVSAAGLCSGQRVDGMQFFTYRPSDDGFKEEKLYRGLHPMMGKRLHLWRLSNFQIERVPSVEDVYLIHAVARDNPKDERLFAAAEVRDVTPVRDASGRIVQLPHLERMLMEALAAIRFYQSRRRPQERLYWNRVFLYVWPPLELKQAELHDIVRKLAPFAEGLGLEQVVVRARIPNLATGELREMVVRVSSPIGSGLLITFRPADKVLPLKVLTPYDQKVIRVRQRGMVHPYEIIKMLTPAEEDTRAEFPPGDFVEYDFDSEGRLVPVDRPYGQNRANIIVGVIRTFTRRYPEGMTRVLLLGDPSRDLGALAESECRLIISALDLAEEKRVPVEWFPISAGAKISMESGVENMDWIARVLKRLVEFTQDGGEVNLIINGINVGAQPYWNAEATMLMHTRGILVMTPKAAMVLTGKRALDYSGGISAEDNQGIGGYDRIMGVNGQAQYWARDINEACHILFRHYEHTYVLPGERFPRRAETTDPIDRDVQNCPHSENGEDGFAWVGEILSDETNPGRKKPFDIRRVMMAAIDQDHAALERWAGMRAAETAVVWDAHLGGYPVCLIGIESRSVPRLGFVPADGPDQWSAGTLFPQSSKKVARAINAASNNRPVVMLANLSGFDGSPESMRRLQLEYGAEIGRAVVNFKGPIVFCVISRYHGGAYVVFSRALNEQLEVAALEGTYASVIGGAPAAAVVFAGEVEARTRKDERLQALNLAMLQAEGGEKAKLRAQWNELFKVVQSEKLGEMASEFDRIHSVHRALSVGALNCIIPPAKLRSYLIDAVERGMRSEHIAKRRASLEVVEAA
jgi:acetyl/propionyl-CoA carboxylase alpha subunit/acetyl-CoA carboxylase carboxyltransferase component